MGSREYDELAWCYDRYWGPRFHDAARPALQALFYSRLAAGDRVIELCCGSGHLTQELVARGYRVTGIDNSLEMLRCARRRAPEASLVCADAGTMALVGGTFSGAVSTFDSINHLISPDAVQSAFRFVVGLLRPGGTFVFDVNTAAAYRSEWTKTSALVESDAALFVRGRFDESEQLGHTWITAFRHKGGWHRTDVELRQRCYHERELSRWLMDAGFGAATTATAAAAGMSGDLACGRLFVTATK